MCTSYCCYTRLCSDFYLIKERYHLSIWYSDGSNRRILGQNLTTWVIGFSNQICPVGFCKIRPHKQAHPFFRSKNKNQKLGNRSHNKRPERMFVFVSFLFFSLFYFLFLLLHRDAFCRLPVIYVTTGYTSSIFIM